MTPANAPTTTEPGGRLPAGDAPVPARYLAILALLSFTCRLVLLSFKDVVGTDEVIYLTLGRNIWHGLGFQLEGHAMTMAPPLLPLVAGFFSLFTHRLELGTNLTYVLFGGGLVIPFYFLARRIYGPRVAARAGFLIAVYPGLLLSFYWGSMTEPLYTFVLVCAFLFLHQALHGHRVRSFVVAGLFLGLAYLTRSEGILFFPTLLLFSILFYAWTRPVPTRTALRNLLALCLAFLLVSAPYPLFLKRHSGQLSISGKTKLILLAGAMNLEEREKLVGKLSEDGNSFYDYAKLVEDKTVLQMIRENPKVLVGGSFLQIRNFFVTLLSWKVFPAFLVAFVLLGLFRDPWDRWRLQSEVFLAVLCLPFLVFLTFRIWPRYLLPMTPVLLLWTARGVVSLEDWIRETGTRLRRTPEAPSRRTPVAPMVLLTLPLLVILVAKPIKARLLVQYPVEYRACGVWMDEHLPPDAVLLARKPELAYYARRRMHPLPNEDLPAVLQYARHHGIEYLVVDEFFIATRPQLRFLLGPGPLPPDLTLLHEAQAPNGRRVRVFRIQEAPSTAPGTPGE